MSNRTTPDHVETGDEVAEPRSVDPGRFQRRATPEQEATGGSRALAALGLLALVVGVPVGLWLLAGSDPFPTSLPDKETLTGQLTFSTLLDVLLFVVWVAWAFFVVCVAVEVAAARRGGLASPVPLGGPVQKLARALVGALLLAEVISGPAASATVQVEHTGAQTAAASVAVQQEAGRPVRHRGAPRRCRPSVAPRTRSPSRSTWSGTRSTRWRPRATATTTTCGTSPSGTWATGAATRRSTSSTRASCSPTAAASSWPG